MGPGSRLLGGAGALGGIVLGALPFPRRTLQSLVPSFGFVACLIPFALVGTLLSCSNFLVFTGSSGHLVEGPLVILIAQAVVPATLLLSVVLLGMLPPGLLMLDIGCGGGLGAGGSILRG